jgi:hypothetical protein
MEENDFDYIQNPLLKDSWFNVTKAVRIAENMQAGKAFRMKAWNFWLLVL